MRQNGIAAALLFLALSACATAPEPSGLMLVPGPGGLGVAGSGGREISFGRDRIGALQSVAKVTGRTPVPAACGAGRDAFDAGDGLRLIFEGKTFVGWTGPSGAAGRNCH